MFTTEVVQQVKKIGTTKTAIVWHIHFLLFFLVVAQVPFVSTVNPGPRVDHSLIISGDVLVLVNGYNDNLVFDDMWYFNITTSRWLLKESFVHALYPPGCTDDLEYIKDNNCTAVAWER